MATAYQNLSSYDPATVPDASNMRVAIVCAEWNANITENLLEGACNTLEKHGVKSDNIFVGRVPGTFELTFGAQRMASFYYVCQGVTSGITHLNEVLDIPVIFGVLTTGNMQQAIDRSGGKYGNKGDEAAITAIKMHAFACRLK